MDYRLFSMVKNEMLLEIFKVLSVGIFLETAVKGDACTNYTVLSNATRFINYLDMTNPEELCDGHLETKWYRFMGPAGNRMQDHCPRIKRYYCQTRQTGWLNGMHPRVVDGEVERKVCFYNPLANDCCRHSVVVKVKNCSDQYYIYQLRPTTTQICSRYCGTRVGK